MSTDRLIAAIQDMQQSASDFTRCRKMTSSTLKAITPENWDITEILENLESKQVDPELLENQMLDLYEKALTTSAEGSYEKTDLQKIAENITVEQLTIIQQIVLNGSATVGNENQSANNGGKNEKRKGLI